MAVVGFAGVALAHSGLNLFDDYFDSRVGAVKARKEMENGGMRARMGKCTYLDTTNVTLSDTKRIATLFVVFACVLGAAILVFRGWPILIFAAIAFVLGIAYAGPPLRLSYHGLGELVVGFIFGPLVVCAAYFVTAGTLTMQAVYVSIVAGLLVANILNAHAVMDYGPDSAANRKTFSILLGSEHRGFIACVVMVIASYVVVALGIALGVLPIASAIVIVTLPMAVTFVHSLRRYVDDKSAGREGAEFVPKAWMGPFGAWPRVQASGIAWFMERWLLARNLTMMMTILLAIASLTPWYVVW
jgi:1,4-dihydroxy-2-naphthoate octaprenyltransferase